MGQVTRFPCGCRLHVCRGPMPLQSNLPQVLRFGVFQVDVRAGELRKNGVKLKLQEQPFRVLCLLLEHPGEVISIGSGRRTPSSILIMDSMLPSRGCAMLWANLRTLQCSSKRSLDVDIVSSLQLTAPLLQAQQRSLRRTEINQFSQLDES